MNGTAPRTMRHMAESRPRHVGAGGGMPLEPCAKIAMTLTFTGFGTPGGPVLPPASFANVSSFGGGGSLSVSATYIGPAAAAPPAAFADSLNVGIWTLMPGYTITPPDPTAKWDGTSCVSIAPPIVIKQPPPPGGTGLSTGGKVAAGTGIVVGGVALTTLIVATVMGWGITQTLDHAWKKIRGR
jgi:hypothetical protein